MNFKRKIFKSVCGINAVEGKSLTVFVSRRKPVEQRAAQLVSPGLSPLSAPSLRRAAGGLA